MSLINILEKKTKISKCCKDSALDYGVGWFLFGWFFENCFKGVWVISSVFTVREDDLLHYTTIKAKPKLFYYFSPCKTLHL